MLNCLKEVTVTFLNQNCPSIKYSYIQVSQATFPALNADVFNVICPSDKDESQVNDTDFKIKSVIGLNECREHFDFLMQLFLK